MGDGMIDEDRLKKLLVKLVNNMDAIESHLEDHEHGENGGMYVPKRYLGFDTSKYRYLDTNMVLEAFGEKVDKKKCTGCRLRESLDESEEV